MTQKILNKGFTLVELAIVLVIIGFLVAGVTAGAAMIKQAELRSIITDLRLNQVAYNNFISRYNKIPGDMEIASSFWNTLGTCAAATVSDCNGDGDGVLEHGLSIGANEHLKAWKHLSLAGMVSAGVRALTGPNTGGITIGTEAPSSKRASAGYVLSSGGANIDAAGTIVSDFATSTVAVFIGAGGSVHSLTNGALVSEEAFSIDQKMDDALVDSTGAFKGIITGNIRAMDAFNAAANGDCGFGGGNGTYTMATTYKACVLGLAVN